MEEKETFDRFQYIGSVHPVLYDPYKECYYETHKDFFALLVLAGAVLAFGCNPATTPGTTGGGSGDNGSGSSGSFTMNPVQQQAYNETIASVKSEAATREIPADEIAYQLQIMNQQFASLNFKIVDTKEGKPIANGTDENALKARFKPEAL